ncbi:MAG: 3-oxoacyl-ACP reductase FabG [Candidatus Rokubacteria bacterium]|nr:3-oxoacyl-ACP reductase FabG [Candidatus Rokubacteria bacterium]
MRLQGKTALVTGSSKGIGFGIARAFAREGATVVINARSGEDCQAVAAEIEKEGRRAIAIPADLSKSDEVRRLAREAEAALGGRVDILVNNAGQPRVAPSVDLAEADYRHTLDLNLTAYFLLSQEVAHGMLARRSGAIINVSSINGTIAFPQRLAYCVSKAGVNMLTKVMAIEWASQGVRVNAIAPGYVETEMVKGLAAKGVLDRERLARRTPMGRLGLPEEVAEAAVFLASDAAGYVTGSVLTVDGGWMAYGYL